MEESVSNRSHISELIIKQLQQGLTDEERDALNAWRESEVTYEELFQELANEKVLSNELKNIEGLKERIKTKINSALHLESFSEKEHSGRSKVRRLWMRISVAAAVVVLLIGGYWFFSRESGVRSRELSQQERFKNDVDPGKFKAKLTLSSGEVLLLDSAKAGELAKQGSVVVVNENGQLVYSQESAVRSQEIVYNTLSTAKGELYSTVLADGSKIWLNSESSIKFPVGFSGNERKVEITGEAYFKVKHDDKKKFKVVANGIEVEDLGTEFNVNAYSDEAVISTTVVQGSVRVRSTVNEQQSTAIRPGQQVFLNNGQLSVEDNVDVEKITAWKNNEFLFSGDDIQTIMKQLEKWYSVEVEYKNKLEGLHFSGALSRTNKISEVLKRLEETGKVKFEIEGNKIIVNR